MDVRNTHGGGGGRAGGGFIVEFKFGNEMTLKKKKTLRDLCRKVLIAADL